MKECENCSAPMEEQAPVCGQCSAEETEQTEAVWHTAGEVHAEEDGDTQEENLNAYDRPVVEDQAPAPKRKAPLGVIIGVALAVLLIIAVIVGKGRYDASLAKEAEAAGTPAAAAPAETPEAAAPAADTVALTTAEHTNAYGLTSYSVHYAVAEDGTVTYSLMNESGETVCADPASVDALLELEVASCGDLKLTNRELQYYFEQQFYTFYTMYGNYLSYLMDTSIGLDEQLEPQSGDTWQMLFLDSGIRSFQQIAALYQEGKKNGYTLSDEEQAALDSSVDMALVAAQYGYEDVDLFINDYIGPFATAESYSNYVAVNVYANSYANHLYETAEVTADEVEAYYDANADYLVSNYGVEKIDKNMVNVRHILIQPEQTTAEDGTASISDEAWAAAEAEAQRIYDEWKAGAATEETFAELANAHSVDPGSNTNGGLYEEVYPGQMVPEFNDWCFADGRAVGDHTIVKTSYGYHVMFFSGEADSVYWRLVAESELKNERVAEERNKLAESYAFTSDLTKSVIMDGAAPTVPAAEEAAPAE